MTERARFTPGTLIGVRRLQSFDLSPDGRYAVLAIDELSEDGKKYDTNLYRLDLDSPDRGLTALTRTSRRKGQPRFAPDGTLGFLAQADPARRRAPDAGDDDATKKGPTGDEDAPLQLHRMSVDGGEPECLTDLAGGASSFRWTPDGSRVVLLAPIDPEARTLAHDRELHAAWKERKPSGILDAAFPLRYWDHFHGPRFPHVVVADADGRNARDLTPGLRLGLDESDWDVSPDGESACLDFRVVDPELRFERNLFLVDLAIGERRALTTGTVQHWGARFSPDGRRIACLAHPETMRVTGKRDIKLIDAATGSAELITTATDLWPDPPTWVDDERLVYAADERGSHGLRLLTLSTRRDAPFAPAGHVGEARISADRKTLYYVRDRIDAPMNLWAQPIAGGEARQLTRLNEQLAGVAMSPGIPVELTGSERKKVQLWEVRPPDFDERKKYPLLLWIHGGPLGSYLDQFHFRWNPQVYAAAGYVVIEVNPRGSTGFGQEFVQDNNGDWSNRCYQDLMRAVDEYEGRPYVDRNRIAALGASFGGYMVNWIAGHTERFKCLVSHAGLFHLPAFWGTTDCGPEWELEFGGTPWADPELYETHSPHHHVENFRTPTLVIHGELDYRVPIGEGLQMFQALQRKRVPSKFLYFPDENHWILKPANLRLWNETVLAWLEEWV